MNDKKRQLVDKDKDIDYKHKNKLDFGLICNTTRKKISSPVGMDKRYCAEFLDVGEVCMHGKNCRFTHTLYPSGFMEEDRALMAKHVQETNGLSFKDKNVS